MYQIDNGTAASSLPASTAAGTPGYFTDGNPAAGQAATVLPSEFMNMMMLENLNVLSAAGVVPSKASFNQLALAIKTIIQGGATTYAADTGVANAYVLALTPAITAYTGTTKVRGLVAHTNTGACTLDAGGGPKALVGLAHAALQGGEMFAGGYFEAQYNVALGKFILLWCTGAAEQVANATQSQHALTLGQAQAGASTYAVDTGVVNAYVLALTPAVTAYTSWLKVRGQVSTTNTGASTLDAGAGPKPLVGLAHAALQGGEMVAGGYFEAEYNTTLGKFILLWCSGAPEQVGPATQSQHAVQLGQIAGLVTGSVTSLSADTTLTAAQKGLVIIDATAAPRTITLPAANAGLGVIDFIVRRLDNTANTLTVTASGTDKIKFHTHLNAAGYSFLVLMGAGDYWHLRSDGLGSWWPVSRYDNAPVGRITPETTTAFNPGGYGAANGPLLTRATWPWLWDLAQASGMLTTEAARSGMEGGWTSGDGATTFRAPDPRGRHHRFLDESAGIDASRAAGSSQADQFPSHAHLFGSTAVVTSGSGTTVLQPGNGSSSSTGGAGAGSETRVKTIAHPGRIKMI
jgi:hypothetical protein